MWDYISSFYSRKKMITHPSDIVPCTPSTLGTAKIPLKVCRICLEKDDSQSPFVSPCLCKGSQEFVHLSCLRHWQDHVMKGSNSTRAFICSVCRSSFTFGPWQDHWYQRISFSMNQSWQMIVLPMIALFWFAPILIVLQSVVIFILCWVVVKYVNIWSHAEFHIDPVQEVQTGVLLVATNRFPEGSAFHQAVVLLLQHDREAGSHGVVINKSFHVVNRNDVIVQEGEGGPVRNENSPTVIHNCSQASWTKRLGDGYFLGIPSQDLTDVHPPSDGTNKHIKVLHGYAGWSPLQLESDILSNSWKLVQGTADTIFNMDDEEMWRYLYHD